MRHALELAFALVVVAVIALVVIGVPVLLGLVIGNDDQEVVLVALASFAVIVGAWWLVVRELERS